MNSRRKAAAVHAPAARPPELTRSAISLFICSRYSIVQGHRPAAVAGVLRGPPDGIHEPLGLAEDAGCGFAERDDAGSGQSRDVHEVGCAKLLRIPEAVAEYQAPFGVRVDDFNRLAARAGEHVPGFDRAAARHVLRCRDDADDAQRRLQQRNGPHGANHRGAAGHVVLHPFHALGRLDGDTAGVEGHALSDKPEHR